MEEELRAALGLPETADQPAILAAVTAALNASTAATAAMARIAEAAGLAKDAGADALVTAINARKADDPEKTALEAEVRSLNQRLTTLVTETSREKAVAVVDKAVEDGRLVPALRDRYVARHMREPAEVEAELKLMPSINSGGLDHRRMIEDAGAGSFNDADAEVIAQMGLDPKAFAETAKSLEKEFG